MADRFSGKTSTAECVAQLLGKPLFPITCGDLGTSADQVETQLYEIFGKAEKWDCVLLLDEADVFLASRGKNDLKRNAVVSGDSVFSFFTPCLLTCCLLSVLAYS
jgi:SpoVK/Ycf46/Vps4 family AAA+-type ATPase